MDRCDESAADRELLARHVSGDTTAFGELVRRHRDRLWAVALRTLGDREEASDAVQDALLSAYRAAHTYRGQAAVTTWLHRITVNACLDRVRKAASRKTAPVDDTERLESVLEPSESAAAPAERHDLQRQLRAALATLAPDQRAALVLVDMQGYPVAEAARILDVPIGTVKSRCARGRAKLLPLLTHLRAEPDPDPHDVHRPRTADTGEASRPDAQRNRAQSTSVPRARGPRRAAPGETDPTDSAVVKGGGGRT
ncbi:MULTISPECIES: RNA polymerase sigma factor SigM [unclassified Streptomyces]|uniref:RNA polymerase sigma factor SigM n=1 Tax=unclassified Streptomyces TaxID=2593676 RepID=UPI001908FD2B|nr:RNA polymerase sigma factor SigM [Streptomyces sp. HSG2]